MATIAPPSRRPATAAAALACAALLLCAACSKPEKPATERPPEPKAAQGPQKQ